MIRYKGGYKYQLVSDYVCETGVHPTAKVNSRFIQLTPSGLLLIRKGYAWDGPSGPTFDTDNFMRGSLVHDALYQLMREELISLTWREQADRLLRQHCREDGMSAIRAWWVYRAVRYGGLESGTPEGEREIREAP